MSVYGAESGTRTRDLRITNALLYQLSYFGLWLFSAKYSGTLRKCGCKSRTFCVNCQIKVAVFFESSADNSFRFALSNFFVFSSLSFFIFFVTLQP